MANNTITFDPTVRTPYGANLTMYTGVDFEETFKILNNDRSNYDLTSHTMYSRMTKTVAVGSSGVPTAEFTESITGATSGCADRDSTIGSSTILRCQSSSWDVRRNVLNSNSVCVSIHSMVSLEYLKV